MRMRLPAFFIGIAALVGISGQAYAVLNIEITQGVEGAVPIAVVPFGWTGPAGSPPEAVGAIIAADLARSGRFAPLPEKDLMSRPHDMRQVNFRDWRLLNVENLVIGNIVADVGGYTVQFQLFDVFRAVQLTGYSVATQASELRRTAHQISDIIYETLTGVPGAFATRIVYVTESREADAESTYSLQTADADGYDAKPLIVSKSPIMSPSWAPDGRRVAYVSFENGQPEIYIQELATGKRDLVSSYPGLNGAPAWSPDGSRLAVVLSRSGNPDIYILRLADKSLRRITDSYAIDTEPAWSPDGTFLVFTSDRGGQPQLYRVPVSGGPAERLTFEGSYNSRAAFSPDGRLLAMVHGDQGQYRIAVMDLKSDELRVMTDSRLDESPSFAPNGSIIIYATEAGTRTRRAGVLATVSVDGRVRQRLALQEGDVREPAWSPFKQ